MKTAKFTQKVTGIALFFLSGRVLEEMQKNCDNPKMVRISFDALRAGVEILMRDYPGLSTGDPAADVEIATKIADTLLFKAKDADG